MNYLAINQWYPFPHGIHEFWEKTKSKDYDKIILFGQNEWEYYEMATYNEMIDYCKSQGKQLHVITAAHLVTRPHRTDNTIIDFWDTHWIGKTYVDLSYPSKSSHGIDPYVNVDYKYHFVSMNFKAYPHRCLLLDLLAKNNLMQYGAISTHVNTSEYQWKYFHWKKMMLEQPNENGLINTSKLPEQYYQSFAQIISETAPTGILLSEKTATPLIIGKPFLVAGYQGFHKFLSELGFELYTELFDYSFDSEPDMEKRYQMVLDNFNELSKTPLSHLNQLREKVASKVHYNKTLAKKIAFDYDRHPNLAIEVRDHYKNTGEVIDDWTVKFYHKLEFVQEVNF